jgi:hypothetical protein
LLLAQGEMLGENQDQMTENPKLTGFPDKTRVTRRNLPGVPICRSNLSRRNQMQAEVQRRREQP